MSYSIYIGSEAIKSCNKEQTINTKKSKGTWLLAVDICLSILAATAFTLAILVATEGFDLPELDLLSAVPLDVSIGLVTAAGCILLIDFVTYTVKKCSKGPPSEGLFDLLPNDSMDISEGPPSEGLFDLLPNDSMDISDLMRANLSSLQ